MRHAAKPEFGPKLPKVDAPVVVGYSNVGKSTVINKISKTRKTKVENKPGVTRQQQWVDVKSSLEVKLLDTPGIIPAKLYSPEQGLKLALCNSVSQNAYDQLEVAGKGLLFVESKIPGFLKKNFDVDCLPEDNEETLLCKIAEQRKWYRPGEGQVPDLERAAYKFLSDFQKGSFGPVFLD